MRKIVYRPTRETFGMPNPFIKDGSYIIAYQDKFAEIVKYHEPTKKERSPSWSHIKKNENVSKYLLNEIYKYFPEDLKSDDCSFYSVDDSFLEELKNKFNLEYNFKD